MKIYLNVFLCYISIPPEIISDVFSGYRTVTLGKNGLRHRACLEDSFRVPAPNYPPVIKEFLGAASITLVVCISFIFYFAVI